MQAAGFTTVNFIVDGNGGPIQAGVAGDFQMDFNGTIFAVSLLGLPVTGSVTGSVVFDLWKDTYANFPPTVGDSICASAKPTISSGIKATDTTLTGWTKTFLAGQIYRVNIDSISDFTRITLALKVRGTG